MNSDRITEISPTPWDGAMVTGLSVTISTPIGFIRFDLADNATIVPAGLSEMLAKVAEAVWPTRDGAK